MQKYLSSLLALLAWSSALAQAPEPAVESNPIGTIIFAALFVGFCVVFAWMVWRNKGKDQQDKNQ